MPRPVCAAVATIGASGRTDAIAVRTSSSTSASHSSSTRSAFVSATTPRLHAEQSENREVLARLRHHAFVGGDDEQRDVDSRRAGDHRAHEGFVPGNVDDADRADAVEHERRESKLDRDAAPLLLRQADRCRHP